eukprot:96346_1
MNKYGATEARITSQWERLERMAHLEYEIEVRNDEIKQLQLDADAPRASQPCKGSPTNANAIDIYLLPSMVSMSSADSDDSSVTSSIVSEPSMQDMASKIKERDTKIQTLEATISNNKAGMEKMKNTIEKLSDDIVEEAKSSRDKIADLESQCSDQENIIEFLKAEMVKTLASKIMFQDLCEQKVNQSQQRVAALEASSSSLEDEIEKLKIGSVR